MSAKKKKNGKKRKPNPNKIQNTNQNEVNEQSKSYSAPKNQDSKPLILRILVLTMAAVLLLGVVVGSIAMGAGF